jgi:hypothetical protein
MGYQIQVVPEVDDWLTEMRQDDPVLATLVDEAGRRCGSRGTASAPVGGPRPEPQSRALELYELRPGAPGKICARILFALDDRSPDREVEPDWTALLLAAGTVEDWLRAWYQDAELLCRARYRRTQFPAEQSPGEQSQGAQSTPEENAG